MTEPVRIGSWHELDLRTGGRSLIEASAGTGKTWTIAVLYLRLLLEGETPHTPRQIVVGTFSEAAAQELRDRLRARLLWAEAAAEQALRGEMNGDMGEGEDAQWLRARWQVPAQTPLDLLRVRLAQAELDIAPIGTLHSLCRRILADFPVESGSAFAAGEIIAEASVLDALVDDLWRELVQGDAPLDPGDERWIAAGRSALRDALRAVLAPGVGVRASVTEPLPSPEQWQALIGDAHALVMQPQCFARSNAALLTALRRFVEAGESGALDAFDADLVLRHAEALPGQLKPAALADPELRGRLERLFDALRRRNRAAAAYQSTALERYRLRLLERRREQLQRESRLTFNLLLEGAARALRDRDSPLARRLREQWPVALVDEFQDTDALQYQILDAIYRDAAGVACGRLVMIGDPKQAIYRFRGGDIHTYLTAAASADEVLRLQTNRRSVQAYVAALNEWYAAAGPVLSTDALHPIRYEPVQAAGLADKYVDSEGRAVERPLQIHYCSADPQSVERRRELALQSCARQIAALLQSGARIGANAVQPGDLAVLLPKNQQIERLRELLQARGVPCVGAGKRSVFDTELARELQLVLYAIDHAGDDAALRAALTTRFGGRTLSDLVRLRADADAWQQQRAVYEQLRREWQRHGVLGVVLALSRDLTARMPRAAERERALTDLRHLGELLQAQSELVGGAEQLLAWFAQQRDAQDGGEAADEWQLRLESDARRVRLLTLHASKGLEFPVVFLPLMWDHTGRAPNLPLTYDLATGLRVAELADGRDAALRRACDEDQEERFRVLYVALTRARYACHVYALSPQRPRAARVTAAATDPERSAFDATLARWQAADVAAIENSPHVAWFDDDWLWPDLRYRSETDTSAPLAVRREPAWPVLEHTYSFTALVAARSRGDQEETAADDENAARDTLLVPAPDSTAEAIADPRIAALAMLRGADFGNAVHAVFERRDHGVAITAQTALIEAGLREYAVKLPAGIDAVAAIATLVERTLALPLFGAASLHSVPASRQRAEMAFQFVLDAVTPRQLRDACARHGAESLLPAELPLANLSGLMSGKIDLIVEHEGRFHVLDYKTNYLGDALADYAPAGLAAAMDQHHYGFQALLYTVALDRYLRQRLPHYQRARHLGDAVYLFVRACGLAPGAGIWRKRFDDGLIDAVDAVFGARR
ncbi:MAG: UvrD-helicase domain-containing protein [Rhodanobacteraceae bacterium]|nr:UvrD-helicase domain-containing protein [Rhodanobacteraceae bacterium]